ncbi:MAG: hypothetical protein IBX70_14235 [Clostridia bacterium]|nr:hypothetical protein [Clostridia bacterium]
MDLNGTGPIGQNTSNQVIDTSTKTTQASDGTKLAKNCSYADVLYSESKKEGKPTFLQKTIFLKALFSLLYVSIQSLSLNPLPEGVDIVRTGDSTFL